ncbi:hypothetical protein BBO99_00003123 [Phytophthora kernoviae]|uniref:R3H domain-containing protein n=2 Tax=Phytophthora kernoviae TaxID=325452 RepID=A0A3R7NIZ5_9STRA|nr:hypothetical protein G195_003258 [Phytophthora kernoviae 00238/432]KAG2528901.1 hypothetical protein JM16_000967 [Phytophthora kernoviae]KAG2530198.1 hypothetical protein JM18_001048 [Phytophthora kernoviae]RLN44209.1 hypothetical protein BBI17_002988 [Phytophthora kernoviae]RLN82184.1 hypothetical protein BBO99_00003123 [Phytophthora kernoviae]
MAQVIQLSTDAPDVSDSEVSSLCGSELELEMAWGEGPIAPLRTDATADEGVKSTVANVQRSNSNGNGSSRARTPQKRGGESPLARSKRLINIHPIRSAGYLSKPNELPVGVRKQQRWFNDHHFGNRAASTRLEDLMDHMDINVEWRSNFQKLAEPQNEDLQTAFRKGEGSHENNRSNASRCRRKDEWNDAEQMFSRVDRRARTLMLRSFHSFAPFIEAVEYVVLHFIQWREVPSELEVATPLFRMLKHPIELLRVGEKDVRLVLPLLDSAFHRLIIHSVCQFYSVRSRTEANRRLNTKIMVLKSPKKKFSAEELALNSLCEFIRETRISSHNVVAASPEKVVDGSHALELQSKSSECSDGFCMVEAPQV